MQVPLFSDDATASLIQDFEHRLLRSRGSSWDTSRNAQRRVKGLDTETLLFLGNLLVSAITCDLLHSDGARILFQLPR